MQQIFSAQIRPFSMGTPLGFSLQFAVTLVHLCHARITNILTVTGSLQQSPIKCLLDEMSMKNLRVLSPSLPSSIYPQSRLP